MEPNDANARPDDSPPGGPPDGSPLDVIGAAVERTRRACVERFDPMKWLAFAVASWMAWLGGSQSAPRVRLDWDWSRLPKLPDPFTRGPLAFVIVALALFVGALVWVGLTWVRAHGRAMLIDLVARDAGDLGNAWRTTTHIAHELFLTRLAVDAIGGGVGFVWAGALGWWLMAGDPVAPWRIGLVVVLTVPLAIVLLAWTIAAFLLDELVLPVAYAWQVSLVDGAREVRAMASRAPSAFAGYLVARFVAALLAVFATITLAFALCGLSWLPFVTSMALVPVRVFLQSMPLAFLYGHDRDAYARFAPTTG